MPYGIFAASLTGPQRSESRYGNLYYNPFQILSNVFLYCSVLLFAMHAGDRFSAVTRLHGGEREHRSRSTDAARVRTRRPGLEMYHGFKRHHGIHITAGPGGSPFSTPITGGIGILPETRNAWVDNWYLWGMKHGIVAPLPDMWPTVVDFRP